MIQLNLCKTLLIVNSLGVFCSQWINMPEIKSLWESYYESTLEILLTCLEFQDEVPSMEHSLMLHRHKLALKLGYYLAISVKYLSYFPKTTYLPSIPRSIKLFETMNLLYNIFETLQRNLKIIKQIFLKLFISCE